MVKNCFSYLVSWVERVGLTESHCVKQEKAEITEVRGERRREMRTLCGIRRKIYRDLVAGSWLRVPEPLALS